MKIDPNAPAFPVSDTVHANGQVQYGANGLTVRAHFAAMAMQGMLADSTRNGVWHEYAENSVKFADALIAALNKEPAATRNDTGNALPIFKDNV